MKRMKRLLTIAAGLLMAVSLCLAQKGADKVEADRMVHDFGDILVSQGPVSCSFKIKNVSSAPLTVLNVVPSCGCTDVKWTRESIAPGEIATIDATYKNDSGPYPFDKTLTVYVSDVKQPLVLHLRGTVHEKAKPLGTLYPVHFGNLGLKDVEIKAGNTVQGRSKSGEFKVANLGKSPITVSFKDVDKGLKLSPESLDLAPGEISAVSFTIDPDRDHWGKNWYYATPLVGGREQKAKFSSPVTNQVTRGAEALVSERNPEIGEGMSRIGIWTVIKEDFSSMSKEEKASAANPMFESSTYTFGKVKAGTRVDAVFAVKNLGKTPFKAYKADTDSHRVTPGPVPGLKPGESGEFKAVLDTDGMPNGEALFIITLTTNSPLRPIINLFISGFIE